MMMRYIETGVEVATITYSTDFSTRLAAAPHIIIRYIYDNVSDYFVTRNLAATPQIIIRYIQPEIISCFPSVRAQIEQKDW